MNFLQRYFRRRLAFSSYDAVQVANVRRALQEADVAFQIKQRTDDIKGPPLPGGSAVPFPLAASTEYRLYVDKDDVELAQYLAEGGTLG